MQKHVLVLIDDLDGSDADETVAFSIDGVTFEIDLTAANAAAMREVFSRYSDAGRLKMKGAKSTTVNPAPKRVPVPQSVQTELPVTAAPEKAKPVRRARLATDPKPTAADGLREQREAIRSWAAEQGITVADRGRIPRGVADAFEQARKGTDLSQLIPRRANGRAAAAGPVTVRTAAANSRVSATAKVNGTSTHGDRSAAIPAASFSG